MTTHTCFKLASLFALAALPLSALAEKPAITIDGQRFVDRQGGVVVLRGVNTSGRSKLPPFVPFAQADGSPDVSKLDPLPGWGFNAMRLLFIWEAYEPKRGEYDEVYLDRLKQVVDAAWERGISTLIDYHQDIFSRFAGIGCGDGFPEWTVPAKLRVKPKSGAECGDMWSPKTIFSPSMHLSFRNFYKLDSDVHAGYIEAIKRLAAKFKGHPGVLGYDVLNEPWGDEMFELSPVHEKAARAVRSVDPDANIFVTPGIATVFGREADQSLIGRPGMDRVAYSPHFYDPLAAIQKTFIPWITKLSVSGAFKTMKAKARELEAPLFLGEFGAFATTKRVNEFMDLQYDHLDADFISSAQWSYTPEWNSVDKDGWNQEDLSIVDDKGALRGNYRPRPYASRIAGEPVSQKETHTKQSVTTAYSLTWNPRPQAGETVVFVPEQLLGQAQIETSGPIQCSKGASRISCRATGAEQSELRVRF